MSHLSLDARAILQYLNDLGYGNISAETLREFLRDLRKLIKYEQRHNFQDQEQPNDQIADLFRRTTAKFHDRFKEDNKENEPKTLHAKEKNTTQIKHKSKTDVAIPVDVQGKGSKTGGMTRLDQQLNENLHISKKQSVENREIVALTGGAIKRKPLPPAAKPQWKSSTDDGSEIVTRKAAKDNDEVKTYDNRHQLRKTEQLVKPLQENNAKSVLIARPGIRSRANKPLQNDPVALYQYYKSEWEYFREQIPGDHSNYHLRWQIRQKLLNPE